MKKIYFSFIVVIILVALCGKSICQNTPWQHIGPDLGNINSLAKDKAHPDTIYAATPYGVYKTVDGSENWNKTGLDGINIKSVVVSKINPSHLLAMSDFRIFKSDDYGTTWNLIGVSDKTIGAIAFDPADDQSIWAGVNLTDHEDYGANLWHTKDGGPTWDSVPFKVGEELKLETVNSIYFDPSNDSVIYVSGSKDRFHVNSTIIFVSKDKGETWLIPEIGGYSWGNVNTVVSTPKGYEPHTVYAVIDNSNLFRSLNFGETWKQVAAPFTEDYPQASAGEAMIIEDDNPKWLYISGNCHKLGHLWAFNTEEEKWSYFRGDIYPNCLLFYRNNLFFGSHTGLYLFNWSNYFKKDRGMDDVRIVDLLPYPNDPDKLLSALDGNLAKTNDLGNNWSFSQYDFLSWV